MHSAEMHEIRMSMWEYDMAKSIENYRKDVNREYIRKAIEEFWNGPMTIQELRDIIIYYSA